MGKIKVIAIVDIVLLASLAISALSGIVLWIFVPRGHDAGKHVFLGATREMIVNLHIYFSLIMLAFTAIHIVPNYRAFEMALKRLFK
ncbi:MAG: DUF4405 domain-containing protein [Candidatus Baldrarchaeia archaeon]